MKTSYLGVTTALTRLAPVLFLAGAIAAPAHAQDAAAEPAAQSEGIGDIVVTAQRREQNLQKVPIAITAVVGESLRSQAITQSTDIVRLVPGVSISGSSAGESAQYTMRGVTQNDFAEIAEGPIAVYVDDSYIPNLQAQNFGFFDVERVEVLKGPQGILFGRNATGGLVHYIVNKPTDTAQGFGELTYGSWNRVRFEGGAGGPIADSVTARASVLFDRNGSIWKNVYPEGIAAGTTPNAPPANCCSDLGQRRNFAGRLQIQAEPSDDLTVRLAGAITRQRNSTGVYSAIGSQAVTDADGRIVNTIFVPTDAFGYAAVDAKDRKVSMDLADSNANFARSNDVNLHVDYDLGGAQLVSITSYRRYWKQTIFDADASPMNFLNFGSKGHASNYSEELRLQGSSDTLNWSAGIFLLGIDSHFNVGLLGPVGSVFSGLFGMTDTGADQTNDAKLKTRTGSVFGQLEYKLTPELTIIAGARGIIEKQDYDYSGALYRNGGAYEITTDPADFVAAQGMPYSDKRTQHLWSGKVQLQYEPTNRLMFYAGLNRGVKSGNYNVPLAGSTLAADQFAYGSETLLSYEVGSKLTFWDGKARLNTSFFYYDYQDYQAYSSRGLLTYVLNKPAENYGAEVSLTLKPVPRLQLDLSGFAMHARVKDVAVSAGLPEQTVRPPFAPERQASAQFTYTVPNVIMNGDLSLGGNVYYTKGFFTNNQNFDNQYIKGYTLFGANIRWEDSSDRYSIAFVANNIFDKRYSNVQVDLTSVCGCTEVSYGSPRWMGVTVGYKY